MAENLRYFRMAFEALTRAHDLSDAEVLDALLSCSWMPPMLVSDVNRIESLASGAPASWDMLTDRSWEAYALDYIGERIGYGKEG